MNPELVWILNRLARAMIPQQPGRTAERRARLVEDLMLAGLLKHEAEAFARETIPPGPDEED
jgi:hypothetical protein